MTKLRPALLIVLLCCAVLYLGGCLIIPSTPGEQGATTPVKPVAMTETPASAAALPQPQPGTPMFYRARGPEARADHVPSEIIKGIPEDPRASIAKLAAYLVSGTDDPFLQVKTIHDWVAENISYDFPAFASNHFPSQGAADILKSKIAVCEGYSALFSALCTSVTIQNAVIHGYSRGYGSSVFVDDNPSADNHAWNAVQIRGSWYLVDCTWDSGYIASNKFTRSYSTSYFFLQPEGMIFSHFPHETRWQLLDRPVSASQFVNLPYYEGGFFLAGFTPIAGMQRINPAGSQVLLKIPVPPGLELGAALVSGDGRTLDTNAFAQRRGGEAEISAAFPSAGKWILRLFARGGSGGLFRGVCDIAYDASSWSPSSFPLQYNIFPTDGCFLFSPVSSPLKAGATATFQVFLPGYKAAFVSAGDQRFTLAKSDTSDVFSGAFILPPASQAILYASKGSLASYAGILKYDVSQ